MSTGVLTAAPDLYLCLTLPRVAVNVLLQLDASEAARQAQAAAISRVVGRGGLNEEAAEDLGDASNAAGSSFGRVLGPSAGAGARRTAGQVSEAQVVRHPSEAEVVLRLLQQQIGKLGMARWGEMVTYIGHRQAFS